MKNKSKNFFFFLPIVFFVICSIGFYAKSYFESYNLIFTHEHKFILIVFGAAVLSICAILVFSIFRQFRMEHKLNLCIDLVKCLTDELIQTEDNIVQLQRANHSLILNKFKQLDIKIDKLDDWLSKNEGDDREA